MDYTEGFRERMVRRMGGSEGISANALSRELGISQPTLSRWLRDAGRLDFMTKSKKSQKKKSKTARRWTAQERMRVVVESSGLTDSDLGAFLRREGLHSVQLEEWRKSAVESLSPQRTRPQDSKDAKKIRVLEKELSRKDKALAEVTALLVLKKKLEEIWGDEDDDTPTRKGT